MQLSITGEALDTMLVDMYGTVDTNFRIKDGVIQLKNVADGLYHTLWIDGTELKFALTGEA